MSLVITLAKASRVNLLSIASERWQHANWRAMNCRQLLECRTWIRSILSYSRWRRYENNLTPAFNLLTWWNQVIEATPWTNPCGHHATPITSANVLSFF